MSVPERIERLRRSLAPANAGAVVARPIHVHYLSGYIPPDRAPSYVVVGPVRTVLVSPGPAAERDSSIENVVYRAYSHATPVDPLANAEAALVAAVERAGLVGRPVAIEAEWLPARLADAVAGRSEAGALGDRLERQRAIKDDDELAAIRRAAGIVDRSFAAVRAALRPGRSELAVYAAAVESILLDHGAPFQMECVFISGTRTLEMVGPPTYRTIERGDLLIFDVFPYLRGYKVDLTRTYCAGRATDVQRALHDTLRRALAAGEAALRPGATGGEVDAATRGPIAAAGHAAHSTHHMGHAIGLYHPERPSLVPGEHRALAAGMVITLEPGVYVPGVGGLRLEQNYVVRDGPPEPLSTFPLELIEVDG